MRKRSVSANCFTKGSPCILTNLYTDRRKIFHACDQRKETYVIIGLGNDLDKKPENGERLQKMACNGKGLYSKGTSIFLLFPCLASLIAIS